MSKNILIIDDEPNILKSLEMILSVEEYSVFKAQNLKKAEQIIKSENILLYLVDIMLPDGDGIHFIQKIREHQPGSIIIMISGHASIKLAVEATRKGADDFLEKPLSKDKLLLTLNNFVKRLQIEEKYSNLERANMSGELIGKSTVMQQIFEQVEKIAPTNSKVLITGESGVGKEIIARLIHIKSKRVNKPYIKINCAAIPEELIEAELFGAEKGAYTGAQERRDGKFKQADGGTILLDEIADMSLKTQTKVLRVLQEGEFERVGGNKTLKTDVRFIAATNKNLRQSVNAGNFREDLFFRLHVVPLHIPPLRERKEDIPLLVEHFAKLYCIENNKKQLSFSDDLIQKLINHNWQGNVRELKNLIERLVIMADRDVLDIGHLPADFLVQGIDVTHAYSKGKTLKDLRDEIETQYIKYCLEKFNGNVAKTSELLKVERTYLYKKLKKIGLRK